MKIDTLNQLGYKIDTLYIERIPAEINQQYLSILSDTNAQLNSSYTPLIVSITVLTALIGVGSILAAYFIWRQGKDFKDRQKEMLEEYSTSKINYIELASSLKLKDKEYEKLLNKFKNSIIEKGELNPEQTTTMENIFNEALEKVKSNNKFSNTLEGEVKCKNCQQFYPVQVVTPSLLTLSNLPFKSGCPYCGHIQANNV